MEGGYRVLVTCDLGPEALARFSAQPGITVEVRDIRDPQVLAAAVPGFHGLVVRSNVKVTPAVLAAGTDLQVVGRAGIGVDNIDVEAATRLGVAVVNAPGGNVVTTAEHALALLMSLARKIPQASAAMREGRWEKTRFVGRELQGKTLGVVGVGRIGSAVAERAVGLRMRVLGYDPYLPAERAARLGLEQVDLDRLLAEADFLTVHTGLTSETRGLLGREALAKVKPGLLLVNCARGGIVDETALLEALDCGRVGGAALDVFEVEPPPKGPLHERADVILTPHLGASTVEAQSSVGLEVADNVIAFLTSGAAPNALNVPAVAPEVLRRLGPYLDLADRLGRFLAQVLEGPVETAQVLCQGEAAGEGPDLVTAAFLRGLLAPVLSDRVNAVNAPALARERGIRVATSTTSEPQDFTDLISAEVSGPWGRHLVEGTLFGRREPRVVRFDDYRLDALPRGTLILIHNEDVPGVIGGIGACLGRHGVNIAGMYNGRTEVGGKAISLVHIDGTAPEAVLDDLRRVPHLLSLRQIFL
ncbi:MAG: phosphoglycerate dehydrogenase [Deferrisomatales bacterium]